MRKLILIPEYRPLFAMNRCFGPPYGPLTKPCPTPVDIIGKLLLQTGKEALTIYEVARDPKDPNIMLPPVRLTLDNYQLSYNEIAGITEEPEKVTLTPPDDVSVVNPTVVDVPVSEITENSDPEPVEPDSEPEVIMVKNEEVTPSVEEPEISEPTEDEPKNPVSKEISNDPYAGMTRAERKRARREAAAASAEAAKQ